MLRARLSMTSLALPQVQRDRRTPVSRFPHVLVFAFPEEDLSAAVLLPRPSFPLLDMFQRPIAEKWQRFRATAGTVGSGANSDIVLESSTNRSSWTVRATLALDASTEVEAGGPDVAAAFSGWLWDPATEYLRARCSTMDASTAPKDVWASFEWK